MCVRVCVCVCVCVWLLGFSTSKVRSHRDNFVSSIPVCMFFIPFPCRLALAKTSNVMLNRSSENWCLFKKSVLRFMGSQRVGHYWETELNWGLRCGVWASPCGCFSCCRTWALDTQTSVVVAHGLSCPAACGIFLTQGLNLSLLHFRQMLYPLSYCCCCCRR